LCSIRRFSQSLRHAQFSRYIAAGVNADKIEGLYVIHFRFRLQSPNGGLLLLLFQNSYKSAHAAIRADPKPSAKKSNKSSTKKLQLSTRSLSRS
jgi:hypothetical protein